MATQVFKTEDVELLNGDVVTLRPLSIAKNRRFMKEWSKMGVVPEPAEGGEAEVWDQDKGFDVFIECVGVCLENEVPDVVGTFYDKAKKMTKVYKDYLEENLDMETIYEILDVCAGMKLNDPKLTEAVEQALREDGTISTLEP